MATIDDQLNSLMKTAVSRMTSDDAVQFTLPFGENTHVNHENQRALPSDLLQSALFGIVKPGKRRFIHNEKISSLENIEILQTGEQLDQNDLDVWMAILYLANKPNKDLDEAIQISQYAFLNILGIHHGSANRKHVVGRLERLVKTSLSIINKSSGSKYFGHLVNTVEVNEINKSLIINIDPKIASLFKRTTFVDINDRKDLGNNQLSRWVHIFFLTHKDFHPYLITTLKYLCGSCQSDKHFKNALKKSVEEVNVIRLKKNQRLIIVGKVKIGLDSPSNRALL